MSSYPDEIKARVVVHHADADEWARPELEAFHLPSTSQPPHLFHPPHSTDHPDAEAGEQPTTSTTNASRSPPPPRSPLETEQQPNAAKPSAADTQKKPKPSPPAALRDLVRFADSLDRVLMAVGMLGALVHGCSLPVFLRFFADLVDSFGSHAHDPDTMVHLVVKYAFYFLLVGSAIWASFWAEISCWMWTGERQSTLMRIRYLQAEMSSRVIIALAASA